MQRALSTHLFVQRRLTVEILEQIEAAGLPSVEIFCARQHFDYTDAAQVRELAGWFADHALELRSLHSPLYRDTEWGRSGRRAVVNIAELEPGRRQEAVDEVLRALEVAERIPFRLLVQHVGDKQEAFAPKKFDAARASLEQILEFARARGVEVLLENIPNELSSPARLRELIEKYSLPALGVCFDTGHAHLGGGVEAAFEPLRHLVRSTHVHDNNGQEDDHLFPLHGSIEWDGAMRALGTGTQEFPLQLEVRDTGELADPLEKALESYRRLEELVPAPRP